MPRHQGPLAELWDTIALLTNRVRNLEASDRAEVAGGVPTYTVATLPSVSTGCRVAFASDGRKTGEGAGAGTGVFVYHDGTAWRRSDDGTTVAA